MTATSTRSRASEAAVQVGARVGHDIRPREHRSDRFHGRRQDRGEPAAGSGRWAGRSWIWTPSSRPRTRDAPCGISSASRYSGGDETDAVIRGVLAEEVLGGEHYFRELEKAALGQVLNGCRTGHRPGRWRGSGPRQSEAAQGTQPVLIWLKVSPQTVLGRTGGTDDRPLLQGPDRLKRIRGAFREQRESIYAEADFTVDTDELTVDQVVQRIQQQLCRP